MSKLKKVLALVLALCMVFSAACSKKQDAGNESAGGESQSVNAGGEDTDASYTYNNYISGSPKTWNPHEWETNTDSYIMNYTMIGLYAFDFNEDKDGYTIVHEMAADFPEDITEEYAGDETYGVPADATEGYAYKVALNPDAKWEDGQAITAEDWVESFKRLLDSDIKNYRANSYYGGSFEIANAKNYYNQDKVGSTDFKALSETSYASGADAIAAGEELYLDVGEFWGIAAEDGSTILSVNDETEIRDEAVEEGQDEDYVSPKYLWENYADDAGDYLYIADGVVPEVTWDQVGVWASGDYELTFVAAKPISMFYFQYSLMDSILVRTDLYDECLTDEGSTYGTSVDTYMSYGPYKLTVYQEDKQITMEKNDQWYGYTDGAHEGQYQTTAINTQVIDTQATALQLFLQGSLDEVDLTTADMETYGTSDYILFTPETYTTKITMNSDHDTLAARETDGINKTMLSYHDFRKAISLSLNRTEFCASCAASHQPGYGILNTLYIADPESGKSYRDSEYAKEALCALYGVSDESEITGYDLDQAKELFESSYQEALAAGDISETDTIELEFLMYSSDDAYIKMFNFIQDAFNAATEGTSLEGRLTLKFTEDPDYYDHSYAGQFEFIFSTWGGAQMDPFSLTEVYKDSFGQCTEYKWGSASCMITVNIDGQDVTMSYDDWDEALRNTTYANADADTRCKILAAMELGLLESYATTPVYYRTVASMSSQRIVWPVEDYVTLLEYGGVQYMTYTMDDAEWADYCAEQGNNLTY